MTLVTQDEFAASSCNKNWYHKNTVLCQRNSEMRVIGSKLPPIHSHSYIEFIVPGLIMMQVITSAYSHTVSTLFFAKMVHNLDELIVSPTPSWL